MKTYTIADYRSGFVAEHDMQAALIDNLRVRARRDVHWFAIPNAGKRTPRTAARMQQEGLQAGVADLCIMLPGGRVIWVELKTSKGRQSAAQKAFQSVCETLDHPYLMPRSLDEAIVLLRAEGVLMR